MLLDLTIYLHPDLPTIQSTVQSMNHFTLHVVLLFGICRRRKQFVAPQLQYLAQELHTLLHSQIIMMSSLSQVESKFVQSDFS